MLSSNVTSQVTAGVTILAANAQALGALTVARALAECKGTSMSNELYAKVSGLEITTSGLQLHNVPASPVTSAKSLVICLLQVLHALLRLCLASKPE
jgi:hypothetical protein